MAVPEPDEWGEEPGLRARIVRPYTMTAGRTEATVDLPMEATLRLTETAGAQDWSHGPHARIMEICDTRSVAEVSALVSMPIGVVRVLLSDLVEQGHVRVQATLTESSSKDERLELIERTLRGLRAF